MNFTAVLRSKATSITAAMLMLALPACAPEPEKADVTIMNLMSYDILDESVAGIREGLQQSGYDAKSLEIRVVNANGQMDLLPSFAKEVVAQKPDLVIPVSTPVAQAVLQAAPQSQQVVFSTVTNPTDIGYDRRPANLTGVADVVNYRDNFRLMQALVPGLKTVGMIYNPGERNSQFGVREAQKAADELGIKLVLVTATDSNLAVNSARSLIGRVQVIYIGSDNTAASAIAGIVAATAPRGLPVIASDAGSVRNGALAAVSVDYHRLGVAAGKLAATVLREGKPAREYPLVRFVGDTVVVNQDTASLLKMTIPSTLLGKVPEVVKGKPQ
jgi:putative ABC transport system substrate-binding protein